MTSEQRKYVIVISPACNDRMAEHFEFLARVSVDAAYRLLDRLVNDIQSLELMPYRNPVYERPYVPLGKYRYHVSGKRYRIVYQIVDDTVFVDDIQDTRQGIARELIKPSS